MKEQKFTALKFGFFVFILSVSIPFIFSPPKASADVVPACYQLFAGDSKYHIRDCPAGGVEEAGVANGKCYLKQIQPRQQTEYQEVACSSIDPNRLALEEGQIVINPAGECKGGANCIVDDIQTIVNALSIGVGIVVTIMIIIAGLQYMTSRDNPQAIQAAKSKILNALIAIVAYVFIFVFLQWVVPGGVF